jgi:hypothetical protein
MKKLSQTQFFVGTLTLVVVLALIAILAEGLKKFEGEQMQAETSMARSKESLPPATPTGVADELKKEDAAITKELDQDVAAEKAAVDAETKELTNVTESYE